MHCSINEINIITKNYNYNQNRNKAITYLIDGQVTTSQDLNALRSEIKGDRTRYVIMFNPNSANSGEEIYASIPRLKSDSCLVPNSLYLVFDFKNANTKKLVP